MYLYRFISKAVFLSIQFSGKTKDIILVLLKSIYIKNVELFE